LNGKLLIDFYFIYTFKHMHAALSITKATTEHIPLIRSLTMQVWPQTYMPIIGADQVAYMLNLSYTPEALEQQMSAGHQFIICYKEHEAVAFASYSMINPGIYKLHKIYTLPQLHGMGVGKYMIQYITEELKRTHAQSLQLNVNRYNSNAIAFYNKTGFKRLYDEDIDIGNGYFMNDHVLGLDL
jgi:diamine N-acetyltransferase